MKIKVEPMLPDPHRAMDDRKMVVRCRKGVYDVYPKPELPPSNTTEQLAVRAAWRAGVAAWGALTPEQKAAWKAQAMQANALQGRMPTGRLTGYRMFQSSAKYRQILGLPILNDPKGVIPPAAVTSLEPLPDPNPRTFRFRVHHDVENPEVCRLIVSISPPTSSPKRKPDRRNGRHIKGYGVASTVELPPSGDVLEFTDARFAVLPGQRFGVWVRIVHPDSGTSGPEYAGDFIRPKA